MATEEKKEKKSSKNKSMESKNVFECFTEFKKTFEETLEVEEKIAKTILFMRETLSQIEGARLKDFWHAKELCAPFFKEKMNPIKRNHLYLQYVELNREARHLKEIMDEQAAFYVEQIHLAIEALELDFNRYDELIECIPQLEFPKNTDQFIEKQDVYRSVQRELHFLKALVSRLDALRTEIIDINMRIGTKNKLLKRLAKLGGQLFPKRKQLIKEISGQFLRDVEGFVKKRFSQETNQNGFVSYILRGEIKSFQSLAKRLTLNTHSFTKARQMLSQCWNQINEVEKNTERECEKNERGFALKIEEFKLFCSNENQLKREKILEREGALQAEMKSLLLSREGAGALFSQIQKIRKEALSKIQDKIELQKRKDQESIENLKNELIALIEKKSDFSLEAFVRSEAKLLKEYDSLTPSLKEKQIFNRHFLDLRGFILDKKEEMANTLSELEAVLEERGDLLVKIKDQIESYRKEMGGSGLDFEKAMTYRELYSRAKIHLDREGKAVDRLEETMIEKKS